MTIVRKTLTQIKRDGGGMVDRKKLRATTDDDIARMIADDPDLAPDLSSLGPPLPNVRGLRRKLGLTQSAFASRIRVPLATVRNWEQGRTYPDPAAVALLTILDREPRAALRALAS